MTWTGINPSCNTNNCQSEHCKNSVIHSTYDTFFCECHLCDTEFWRPNRNLFLSEGQDLIDLDSDADVSSLQESPLSTYPDSKLGPHKPEVFDLQKRPLSTHPELKLSCHKKEVCDSDLSSDNMTAELPRIFNIFAHRAFKAADQQDDLQVPAKWSYHHVLTDPWLSVKMKKFDASTTFFLKISLDCINMRVRRTQTRKTDTCIMALIFLVDCVTGFFFCLPTYDLSIKSLISALNVLFIQYAQLVKIICDAHATFRSIAMSDQAKDG